MSAAAFIVGLYAIVLLIWAATRDSGGAIAYGMTVSATLAMGLVTMPALSGALLAGGRENGTLDLIRATRIRSVDLTLGLLAHLALVSAGLVGASVPLLILAAAAGGVDLASLLLAPIVQWCTLCAVGAVSLAVSASTRRARTGVAMALLVTGALVAGTALTYALAVPWTETNRDRQVQINASPGAPADQPCTTVTRSLPTPRTNLVWWLLAPNPVIVVADAAPAARVGSGSFDPLGAISATVRAARAGVGDEVVQECWGAANPLARPDVSAGAPVWPWGLAALIALAAGSSTWVARRLRIPASPRPNRWATAVSRQLRRLPLVQPRRRRARSAVGGRRRHGSRRR